jgi:hypothetical protein
MNTDLFHHLRDTIRTKRSEKWRTNNLFLPHDTAPAHRSVLVKDNVTILENPFDLAPVTEGTEFFLSY